MQISRGGTWAIGVAAVALFAVLVSYAPASQKARTAALVASGYYAVDEWTASSWDYSVPQSGYEAYEYDRTYAVPARSGGYYEEYEEYEEYWYEDVAPRTGSGWYIGGSVSPFPSLTTPILSGLYPPVIQAQPIIIGNPNYNNYNIARNQAYAQQQLNTTIAYNNRVAYSNYVASQPRLPQPSCGIKANPAAVPAGGSTTLTWGSEHGTSATLDAVGTVPVNGSYNVSNITSSRTFGLAVTGPGGTGACYAFVSVRTAPELTCLISTNPAIIAPGQSATLAWGTTGAASAVLSGPGGAAAVPLSGAIAITPVQSTNYTISMRDALGNTQSCTTGILVQ